MINGSKTTQKTSLPKIAGTKPNDHNIEFFGDFDPILQEPKTYWMQRGNTHAWEVLPHELYNECLRAMLADILAVEYLTREFPNACESRLVELFMYHNYGDYDGVPDMIDGKLQPAENFRTSRDCPSLEWKSKDITTQDGNVLTRREIKIIDLISDGETDKVIASEVNVSTPHFNTVKKKLFNKFGVQSKTELMVKAMRVNVPLIENV